MLSEIMPHLSSPVSLLLLGVAIAIACGFEFINGFHDTANSVATVIYTRSLKPWKAVAWSGVCNFVGVFLGGISVAMGIVKLLPVDLVASSNMSLSLITVFSMLLASCIWNLATWFVGIPASSSHALIGGILGVGVGNAISKGLPASAGINWVKTGEVGLSLLVSPLLGFGVAALAIYILKRVLKDGAIQSRPINDAPPPFLVRLALVGTSTGVSIAHGSNDGQKGVGLVMLILIAVLPGKFALSPQVNPAQIQQAESALQSIELHVSKFASLPAPKVSNHFLPSAYADNLAAAQNSIVETSKLAHTIRGEMLMIQEGQEMKSESKLALRKGIYNLESKLSALEKAGYPVSEIKPLRKTLTNMVEYAPLWVIVMIAISLGLGTMIGWKRVVETLGEKIGTSGLTYAQGTVSQAVAMSMIGVSALAGVPVSTTHCLSSGIAGSMVASGSSVQKSTVRSIGLAWVLTLPVTLGLSCGLFLILKAVFIA